MGGRSRTDWGSRGLTSSNKTEWYRPEHELQLPAPIVGLSVFSKAEWLMVVMYESGTVKHKGISEVEEGQGIVRPQISTSHAVHLINVYRR